MLSWCGLLCWIMGLLGTGRRVATVIQGLVDERAGFTEARAGGRRCCGCRSAEGTGVPGRLWSGVPTVGLPQAADAIRFRRISR